MTTQLTLYNNALVQHLGERALVSLTENRKPRRILDGIWDSGFVKGCLEDGYWNFATRTFSSEYNPSIEPSFGFRYGHDKPDDWVRTSAISSNDYFGDPLLAYNDETAYWFTDFDLIFVRIISDDAAFGGDLTSWPESFSDYAEIKLAARACMAITKSRQLADALERKAQDALKVARNKDAMNDPSRFPPPGRWVSARRGRSGWRPQSGLRLP